MAITGTNTQLIMFSGIIQAIGEVKALNTQDNNLSITFFCPTLNLSNINIGDSIAVDGVCLTIVEKNNTSFQADVSQETLNCTQFSSYKIGHLVNLEPVLTLSQGINGHLVSGHIDGIAIIKQITPLEKHHIFKIQLEDKHIKYCIDKGSICVNGVSLTINHIQNNIISLNIIPHTFYHTNLSKYSKGNKVNIEVDMMAKYVHNFLKQSFSL